jgi:hypothetical protein
VTAGGGQLAGQYLEQRRLAGSVLADDADECACRDSECHIMQHFMAAVRFCKSFGAQHRFSHRASSVFAVATIHD